MFRLSFYPIGDSYLLVAGAGVVLVLLLAIGPRGVRLGRWQRGGLLALRCVVILLVLLAMLRPTLVYTRTEKQQATLVVLADRSRSMSVRDCLGNRTRWQALREALNGAAASLAELADDFEVKVYAFDAEAEQIPLGAQGRVKLPDEPLGAQTAIGAVLEDVLRREAGKRLLAVILLSNEAQRAIAPRDAAPQNAAAQLKLLSTPLYTFGLGQAHGPGQAQDVAVARLLAAENVFVKNELAVQGEVRTSGFVNREIAVQLLFETTPGRMEVVAQKTLRPAADGQLLPVDFQYVPEVTGEFKLTLQAVEQPGELVTTNNQQSTFVNVLGGGLRVLYLEGKPRVEAKFLRRALDASPDINVDLLRIDPRDPATRPGNLGERFQPGKYEVYIFGDLDSSALRRDEMSSLAEAVNKGAGLIMLGGFHSFGPGGYFDTPLARVLPVMMDRFERQNFDEPIREDLHEPGPLHMEPTRLGLLHFALMLAGSRQENQAVWSQLAPLEGANRFRGLAPGALLLADAPAPGGRRRVPLLAAHAYGNGRVMAFAGDSTWRWVLHGHQNAHRRFWRQTVLWLARRDEAQQGRVWVKLGARRFAPGQRVEFTAGAQAPTGEELPDARFELEVVLPDKSRQPLQAVREGDHVKASFRETVSPGDYEIKVTATHAGQALGSARGRFLVFEQDLELDNAAADLATLEALAATTGAKALAPEQLPELIQQLAQQTEALEVREQTKTSLWDRWAFFLLLVGMLGAEWFLRKRWGLV